MRIFLLFFLYGLIFSVGAFGQQVILLYEKGKIPFEIAKEDVLLPANRDRRYLDDPEVPTLTVFRPKKDLAKGTAVIVCSGGSYGDRANDVEGIPACQKLADFGITAFLLDYRLPWKKTVTNNAWVPMTDAQRAIQYLRENANRYELDIKKIGIMGFSAGGHLASTVATHFDKSFLENKKGTNLRPDFVVLVYPVISMNDSLTHKMSRLNLIGRDRPVNEENIKEFSNELQVTDRTPPVYISASLDDREVKVQNSLHFVASMNQHQVPVELFLYPKGKHGYGVNNKQATVQWIDDCLKWIKNEDYRLKKHK